MNLKIQSSRTEKYFMGILILSTALLVLVSTFINACAQEPDLNWSNKSVQLEKSSVINSSEDSKENLITEWVLSKLFDDPHLTDHLVQKMGVEKISHHIQSVDLNLNKVFVTFKFSF